MRTKAKHSQFNFPINLMKLAETGIKGGVK